jgi:hypothetical protein
LNRSTWICTGLSAAPAVPGQQGEVDHQPRRLAAVDVQPAEHLLAADYQVVAGVRERRAVVAILGVELHAQERLLRGGAPGHRGEFVLARARVDPVQRLGVARTGWTQVAPVLAPGRGHDRAG